MHHTQIVIGNSPIINARCRKFGEGRLPTLAHIVPLDLHIVVSHRPLVLVLETDGMAKFMHDCGMLHSDKNHIIILITSVHY